MDRNTRCHLSKIKNRIAMLQRIAPKVSRYGQLYRDKKATQYAYKRVYMWTLYVSDENEHMMRKHIFESKRTARTPKEWHAWFTKHLDKIQRETILAGLSRHTDLSKPWAVAQYIGWTADAKHSSRITATRRKRHKAKSQRGAHG